MFRSSEKPTSPSTKSTDLDNIGEHKHPISQFAHLSLAPSLAMLILISVWSIWSWLTDVPTYIMPSPSDVFSVVFDNPHYFASNTLVTLTEAVCGLLISSTFALALATIMVHSTIIEKTLFPLALMIKVTPIVAVAPLFVIWFGFGFTPKIAIVSLITFFPILVNALSGMKSVNRTALDVFDSLAASRIEVLLKLRIPSSLPYLFAAFRITVPLSIIGAFVAEIFIGNKGLGTVIFVAYNEINMPTLFAAILMLGFLGIILTGLIACTEKRMLFWHESNTL